MSSEFDDRDPELADALNSALSAKDDNAFLQQVMLRVDQGGFLGAPHWWDVLSLWAKPGLAVAVVTGVLFAVAIVSANRPDPGTLTSIAEGLSSAGAAAEMAESAPPNPESMMAVAFAIE